MKSLQNVYFAFVTLCKLHNRVCEWVLCCQQESGRIWKLSFYGKLVSLSMWGFSFWSVLITTKCMFSDERHILISKERRKQQQQQSANGFFCSLHHSGLPGQKLFVRHPQSWTRGSFHCIKPLHISIRGGDPRPCQWLRERHWGGGEAGGAHSTRKTPLLTSAYRVLFLLSTVGIHLCIYISIYFVLFELYIDPTVGTIIWPSMEAWSGR